MAVRGLLIGIALWGCGSAARTCSEEFGQDCGPSLSVTLKYVRDPGFSTDGGTPACAPVVCSAERDMPAAQYYQAVLPAMAPLGYCRPIESSASARTIDCTYDNQPDGGICIIASNGSCTCPVRPSFAFATTCDWAPPLLRP